jgi:hypothetical protein
MINLAAAIETLIYGRDESSAGGEDDSFVETESYFTRGLISAYESVIKKN